MKFGLVLGVILMFTTGTSFANLINVIDFTGNNEGVEDSFLFSQSGVDLTVSAWATSVNTAQQKITPWHKVDGDFGVYKGSTGLGVISNNIDGADLDGGRSSDIGDLDEGLLFSFSEIVNFLGFSGGELSSNDDLNLAVVDFTSPQQIVLTDIFIDVSSAFESDIFDVFPGIIGQHFMVWVDGYDDDVRILDTAFVKVSEPFTLPIFIFSMMLVAGYRRM